MVKIHDIVRVGNNLLRIHAINGENIEFVNGLRYNAGSIVFPAFPANTTFVYNGRRYKAAKDIEILNDDTIIETASGHKIPLFENYKPCISNIIFSEKDEGDSSDGGEVFMYEEDFMKYLDISTIKYKTAAIRKTLRTHVKSKTRLKSILSKHPAWSEEGQCIDMIVDVPNIDSVDKAQNIYRQIISKFQEEFPKDQKRLDLIRNQGLYDFNILCGVTKNTSTLYKSFNIHISAGMKKSRAIRKFFAETGIDRIADFEKLFAELSDYLSNKPIKRRITLSIHPLDYLRMSEGNSWTSCHNIRKNGCYCNGALSYLMDSESMVLSVLDPNNETATYWQPKINRMMFFLNEENDILQSRLYPQTRIPQFEDFLAKTVNKLISECLEIENSYKEVCDDRHCKRHVNSTGVHYRDYECDNYGQKIWSCKDSIGTFYIGHESYCVKCGEVNTYTGQIHCCDCRNDERNTYVNCAFYYTCPLSGNYFYLDTDHRFNVNDGRYYYRYNICKDCGEVFFDDHKYCPNCREKHNDEKVCSHCGHYCESLTEIDGELYCEDCADELYTVCPDCGEYVRYEDAYYITNDGQYVCGYCFEHGDYFYDEYYSEYRSNYENSIYIEGYGRISEQAYDSSGEFGYCEDCGYYYHEEDMTFVRDDHVCNNCVRNHYTECAHCGELIHDDDIVEIDGEGYCRDCVDRYANTCSHCGTLHMADLTEVDGEYLCEDCYENETSECSVCGERHLNGNMTPDNNDTLICNECLSERSEDVSDELIESSHGHLNREFDNFAFGLPVSVIQKDGEDCLVSIIVGDSEYYRNVPSEYITFENIAV